MTEPERDTSPTREWLPRLAWSRPVTVLMAFIALLVLGVLSMQRIPLQMMADGFEIGQMWIQIPWSDASPKETDEQIVRVVEAQLATIPGVDSITSRASTSSASFSVSLHQGVDGDDMYNAIIDRLERAMLDLPEDVERYNIYRFNPNDTPIIWAGVQIPDTVEDPHHLLTKVIQPRLERINGVASIDFWGVPQRQVRIDFDKERVYGHGINLSQVQQAIRSDNFQMSTGQLEDRGSIRHVRSLSRITGLDDLERYPVRDGLVLGDIAEVYAGGAMSSTIDRINGENAAAFAVNKESSANTVAVSLAIEEALDSLSEDPRAGGLDFFVFFNQGELIQESLGVLTNTALTGGFFAVLILFLFLREWKMTLLIAASIPFSVLITISVLYFRGDSLNLLSLMGLMLAVGMVVDNAIVVVETIYRRRANGAGVKEAAIQGTAEVNLAILLSTLTTMVVFLPVILMSESAAFSYFMSALGLPVVFALGGSLVVALVFAPLATRVIGRAAIKPNPRWIDWLTARYERVLSWTLRRRTDSAMALLAMVLLTGGIAYPGVKCTGEPGESMNEFNVRMQVSPQMTSSERRGVVDQVESILESNREDWGVRVYRTRMQSDSNRGNVTVYLHTDGPMTRDDVMEEARKAMPQDIPGVRVSVGWEGGGGGRQAQQISLQVNGENLDVLTELADEVVRRVSALDGVLDAYPDVLDDGSEEVRLRIKREAITRQGLTAQQVGGTVAWAMRQNSMSPLRQGDFEIPVISAFMLEDRSHLDTLLDFEVFSMTNMSMVPLRAVTDIEMGKGPRQIRRKDRRTGIGVTVDLEDGTNMLDMFKEVEAATEDMVLPRGYEIGKGDRWDNQMEDDAAMQFALILSVAFVFLLMGVLFESFVLPLAIITTIPMAMMGALWGLYLSNTGVDTMAGVGFVILVGVVVNNGIVLVDLIEQLRGQGVHRDKALLEAGRRRLRPILMTALTTICGLMPMALGSQDIAGVPYAPLGRTVIGGLIAGTLLTLLFVPYLYTLLDDLRGAARGWFHYLRSATQ